MDSIAAAAAVFVLILGGLGIWLGTRGDDDKPIPPDDPTSTAMSTSERTRTSRTPPPTQNPDSFEAKLMSILPRGYDDGVCAGEGRGHRCAGNGRLQEGIPGGRP